MILDKLKQKPTNNIDLLWIGALELFFSDAREDTDNINNIFRDVYIQITGDKKITGETAKETANNKWAELVCHAIEKEMIRIYVDLSMNQDPQWRLLISSYREINDFRDNRRLRLSGQGVPPTTEKKERRNPYDEETSCSFGIKHKNEEYISIEMIKKTMLLV